MKPGDVFRRSRQFVTVCSVGERIAYAKNGRVFKRKRAAFEKEWTAVDMQLYMRPQIVVQERDMEPCEVHSDAGRSGMRFSCPVCRQELVYAKNGWWSMSCACRHWDVEIKAIGRKMKEQEDAIHRAG